MAHHTDDNVVNVPTMAEEDTQHAIEVLHSQEKKINCSKRLVIYCFAMGFGSMSFGFGSAIIATTLGQPSFIEYMNLGPDNPDASHILGAINSLFYAGGFFGCIFASWSNDRLGRKPTIIIAAILMIISGALCAGSVKVGMFMVFRFFLMIWPIILTIITYSGLMFLITVPLWITEVAPPHGRGVLAEIHAWMAVLSYLIAAYTGIGFFYYRSTSHAEWRAPLAFVVLWPLLTLIFTPFLPESPRWLLMNGRSEEAFCIVQRLHRNESDIETEFVLAEFQIMRSQVEFDASLDSSWRILFTRPSYRRRLLLSASVLFILYSTGTQVITNYAPSIYAGLNFSAGTSLQFSGGQILVALLAISISMLFVEKVPRNWMLGGGTMATAIPLAIETVITAKYVGSTNTAGLAAGVAFIYMYTFVYTIFLDGPGYFYASELFPTHLRAKGSTVCMACYCLTNILWTQVAPTAFRNIQWRFYIVFIVNAIVFSICQILFYPNTLNKPLEEVAEMFGDHDLVGLYRGIQAERPSIDEKLHPTSDIGNPQESMVESTK
ncbi:hypothetical protein PV08_05160 [Exophiala spinifera]|uniref:Major facilitator superfamily (MFS) profile domain-containing protein n=1 Tax=Exophiala spinifera TaxID=91928 RepID=A0A0D2BH77_9EURO|nr:uncharacterized protein PV08_05160 [Exophiala spinifera]KIW17965.1 hypothetical protein PV08_05160 [Exophiala spinifera]